MPAAIALLLATAAAADDRPPRPRVDAIMPLSPTEHQRLHFFGRRHHHLVPGTVTINRSPYACDVDAKRFTERDAFIAHIRAAHHTPPEKIPDRLLVRDEVVHFLGE